MEIGPGQRTQTILQRVTAARAAKLDEITSARLGELDAGNIPGDIDTLLTRLNAARAGYLDELAAANIPTDLSVITAYVDELETRLNAARAGYLDWLNIGETVPTQAQINAQVDGALNTAIPAEPVADSVNERIKALDDNYTTARAGKLDFLDALISSRSSHGPGDIWTQGTRVLTNPASPSDLANMFCAISGTATGRAALLDQITAGRMGELDAGNIPGDIDTLLSRITAAVALASVCSDARLGELDAGNMPADLGTLIGRLTAARAGYLDNLIGTQTANTYSHPSGTTEQDALVITPAELGKYERLSLDMSNLAQDTTVRTYIQVDGTNYRLCDRALFPDDFPTDTESVLILLMPGLRTMKVTLQSAVAEGEAKNVPYFYVTRSLA